MSKLQYRGWAIIPNVLPTADQQWTASCDLARVNADGEEVFEAATMQFVRPSQDAALTAACDEARIQIDNLVADPQVRLA
ncbi:hypothetical protein [Duganella callida]|uniref:Uncharacterized protein n=1 Tax=Duganella callida TaxID=2561932 RepID=A0A4Y9S3L2_9BURK|nr:hypothetical protein [Duganella callida]TFW15900.1 hypothetical protein E4L98_24680 [Duganella callida]